MGKQEGLTKTAASCFFTGWTKVRLLKKSLQIIENSTLWLTLAPEECKMNKM